MSLILIPDPVTFRISAFEEKKDEILLLLAVRDAAHATAAGALIRKAAAGDYAIEIKLIHYEGQPDMVAQRRAREAKR